MSKRFEDEQQWTDVDRVQNGLFEVVRITDEEQVIYRTDDEGDFIRHKTETMLHDWGVAASVSVERVRPGWFRVEVQFGQDNDSDEMEQACTDLTCAFSKHGKGYYENDGEGWSEDGAKCWYIVKHRDRYPWI